MGLGINWAGAAAGYQGYKEEERRTAEDARKAAADAQAIKDNNFKNETVDRQRYEWRETDRKRDAGKSDDDAYRAKHRMPGDPDEPAPIAAPVAPDVAQPDPATLTTGVSTVAVPEPTVTVLPDKPLGGNLADAPQQHAIGQPPVAAAPPAPASALTPVTGMPKPRPMGSIIDMFANRINNAAQRGDSTLQDFEAARAFLTKARSEGVTQAISAWNRGDYAGGMALYNGIGQYNGAKIVGTPVDAMTTLPNGLVVPTHIITVQNADNSRAEINTAADEYKMQSLADRIKQGEEAAKQADLSTFHKRTNDINQQRANTESGYRTDQNSILKERNRIAEIAARSKGNGNSAKLDDKAIEAEVERNPQLYSVAQDDTGKEVSMAAAKSLYHNTLIRLGNPDEAYASMQSIRRAAMLAATDKVIDKDGIIRDADQKTGMVNSQVFLKKFSEGIAAADDVMRAPPPATKPDAAQTKTDQTDAAKPKSTVTPTVNARGANIAKADAQRERYNQTVGGANTYRAGIQARRAAEVSADFAGYLATIKPGWDRATQQKTLAWLAEHEGALNPAQLKQVRVARTNAPL